MKTLVGMFVAAIAAGWALTAAAAPPSTICGPSGSASQSFCITPNADGSIDVNGGGGGGGAVTIADGDDVTQGALADAACATDNGTCSVNAVLKRVAQRLTSLIASLGGTGTIDSDFPASATATGIAAGAGSATGTPDLKRLIGCDSSVAVSITASGNTELVPLTSGMSIYVCGYMLVGAGAVDVQLVYGTGTACATGETDLTGPMPIAGAGGGMAESSSFWRGMKTPASNALCGETSTGEDVSGVVYYTKF